MIRNLLNSLKLLTFSICFINTTLAIEPPKKLLIKDLFVSDQNQFVELNDVLFVNYEGWIYDKSINTKDHCSAKGIKFDSTKEKPFREKITPFEFVIGKGLLIPGWELGLLKMKKGDSRKVFLQFVIIEKMTSARLGQYNHQKCCMITRKRQFIIRML